MHSISLDPAVEAVDGVADSIEVPQFAELIPTAADPVSVEVKVTNITRYSSCSDPRDRLH